MTSENKVVIQFNKIFSHNSKMVEHPVLPKGVYRPFFDRTGNLLFEVIEASNDRPIPTGPIPKELCEEVGTFFNNKAKYDRFGFSHKRGYLLHGPPGCGKSSLIRLVQEEFINQFGGVVFAWNGSGVADVYERFRENEPTRPILVVIEDFEKNLGRGSEEQILEFLDGQVGLSNFVIVATTNFLDQIPDRIKNRPSRIDRVIEILGPPPTARLAYLLKLGLTEQEATPIVKASEGLTMAHLKEFVIATLCLGESIENTSKRIRAMKEQFQTKKISGNDLFMNCSYENEEPGLGIFGSENEESSG